ncbi:hypothetical protein BKA62DRAFT_640541 [Auriculariales sp. MPI-PUGE-AT-0066]|nr:hypothetical protein BKA62DRAFT_640541 [Auriculariales sp. MPI-PUGE-AT-0066]
MLRRASTYYSSRGDNDSDVMSPMSPVYENGAQSAARAFEHAGSRPLPKATIRRTARSESLFDARLNNNLSPAKARFRAAALKVMHMQRTSSRIQARVGQGIGAEPGKCVDARRETADALYGHIRERCDVHVMDYSSVRSETHKFDNEGIRNFLANGGARRPNWSKCRWIHVDGVSWDVLSLLSVAYGVHPLALEDILLSHGQSRSKSSYYAKHLFLRLTSHSIIDDDDDDAQMQDDFEPHITDLPRSSSPAEMMDDEEEEGMPRSSRDRPSFSLFRRRTTTTMWPTQDVESRPSGSSFQTNKLRHASHDSEIVSRRAARAELQYIKSDEDRLNIELNNLFVLFWRDGTVVSIYSKRGTRFAAPIQARLRSRETILRSTADPSLLVQSMIDLIVDQTLELIDSYHDHLIRLEAVVLINPKIKQVRALHILEGDLAMRKRTLEPLRSVVYGLRRYDLDRCTALASSAMVDDDGEETVTEDDYLMNGNGKKKKKKVVLGFMSHKAKVYLADVNDHLDYVMSSVDLFTNITENLINYTFNMTNAYTSDTMRMLTLVTIIFMPLTVITGYFGQNFEKFKAIEGRSESLFWYISLPVLAVIIPIFLGRDMLRVAHYLRKKSSVKKVGSAVKAGGRLRRLPLARSAKSL